ncbi:MAG: hypothetical protein KY454_01785 [Actinobacteria bacterium]|nr:hypothetical protein [Actinomycetota bacterium]
MAPEPIGRQVVAATTTVTEAPTTAPPATEPPTTQTSVPPAPTTAEAKAKAKAKATTTAPPSTVAIKTAAPATTSTTASRRSGADAASARPLAGSIESYSGLGTWVDVYDWSHYKGTTPTVGPAQVDQMAEQGVQTLFLQTAKHDTPDIISEPELLLPIIERAHQRGIRVVAWYLPTLEDPANDLNRLVASANLDVDGIAVDIEARNVADVRERNRRLIELSRQLRQALPGRAIGAIVLPPVVLEVINPSFWPDFPYREISPFYDVWQTMGYWTNRKTESGYRDPYRYTDENIRRLRNNLGQPAAPVHPIGGIGAQGADDVNGFLTAAVENSAVGGSVYDWRTTKAGAWQHLRKFRSR